MNTALDTDALGKLVVIGASLGGASALQRIAADLPASFPVPVVIVLHIGANSSTLPDLLAAAGPNTASHAQNGEPLRTGHLAVAPPGQHLLVQDRSLRQTQGPKENWARPAIDPLFRSAALSFGARAIGFRTQHAWQRARVRGRRLCVAHRRHRAPIAGTPCARESSGTANVMRQLQKIATPSALVCPECGGSLWEIRKGRPSRYRCHAGHAFTLKSLEWAMGVMQASP
jgi:two-component system, chemotaxis family, protein-glutamate methylesterase/glutaminase